MTFPIFPESALASSLITTVWIGVMVVCFFNLRFGWNLSGLIVPGYLVPLIILKPWSAAAIIIEALFTYLVVKLFSEIGPKLNSWNYLFGRDRFFAILLVSVIVRLLFDLYFFPQASCFLSSYTNIDTLYHGGLYSIGLVIVALTANQFWKSGFKKGFPELLMVLFITLIIIKYVLLKFTNFRLNEVAYLYESLATSIIASPKACIILLTTAYIASRMNLLYGWEFSGIAIPALLALLWYYPFEIFISILEAIIIYSIASVVLKTSLFSNSTIEGARKILLFFCIAFFYKLVLGFIFPLFFPDIQINDFYGFGYMLTSFIAIKMYDKQLGGRLIGATVMTSGFSVIVATFIGYLLTFFFTSLKEVQYKEGYTDGVPTAHSEKGRRVDTLVPFVLNNMLKLYTPLEYGGKNTPRDIINFSASFALLDNYLRKQTVENFIKVSNSLQKVNYGIKIFDNKYIVLYAKRAFLNGGIFIVSLVPAKNYTAIIPYPTRAPELLASALKLLTSGKINAVAVAGRGKNILEMDSFFNSYLFPFVLHSQRGGRALFFFDSAILEEKDKSRTNLFFTALKNKEDILSDLFNKEVAFVQPKELPYPFSSNKILKGKNSLFLSEEGMEQLLLCDVAKLAESHNSIFSVDRIDKIEKSEKSVDKVLSVAECNFFDTQVVSKIIATTINAGEIKKEDLQKELMAPKFSANMVGYDLKLVDIPEAKKQVGSLSLEEKYIELSPKNRRKNWGLFYFKIGLSSPMIIETATPSLPVKNLILSISNALNPRAIFFNNLKYVDKNRTTLLLSPSTTNSKRTCFNLVRQSSIREFDSNLSKKGKSLLSVIQINQLPKKNRTAPKTIYISTNRGAMTYDNLTMVEKKIYDMLKNEGFNIYFVAGQKETMGLESTHSGYSSYLDETSNTTFMLLWLN